MKSLLTTLLILGLSTSLSYSQTLRGSTKLRSAAAKSETSHSSESKRVKAMKYGNVEAYDEDDNLVGSVLTDEFGNYEMSFKDSGTYHIKVMYAGYETREETITVTENEESDFSLDRDKNKKARKLSEKVYSMEAGYVDGEVFLSNNNAQVNKNKSNKGLTSGEINDFAKWDLWNDYLKSELSTYQKAWKLNPQKRYVVQLLNNEKSPLIGAEVKLLNKSKKVIWQSLTDNTGKAELWGAIDDNQNEVERIVVDYQGNTKEIRSPKTFKRGINTVRMDENCDASNLVEIAFVVDATGSMSDEINFIKRDLNKVMYEAQNLYSDVSINYASVFYRDSSEEYITKHKDFTNVLSEALVYVDDQFAKGGGDMPEAVDSGLDVAINQLSWSEDTRSKLLFLILDAPAHNREQNIKKIQELSKEAAKKGIKIIPITGSGINKSGEYLMRSLALCTNGTYLFLTDHSGVGSSHIKPTIDEYDIKLLTERLTSIIKANIFYPECEQTIPEYEMIYPDSIVEFTMESGQIYHTPEDPGREIDTISDVEEDSVNNRRDWPFGNGNNNSNEEIKKIEWKYYPNPTRDYVYIEGPEEIEHVFLTDLSGKILQKVEFNGRRKVSLYLGDYPVGIYLLRYPIGKQWVTGKVVLVR